MNRIKKKKMVLEVKAEDLMNYTLDMTDNKNRFTKKRTFTFVNRIQNLALDICSHIGIANGLPVDKRGKAQWKIIENISALLVMVEICLIRNLIDHKQCGVWTNKIEDVRNLTKAWIRKTK